MNRLAVNQAKLFTRSGKQVSHFCTPVEKSLNAQQVPSEGVSPRSNSIKSREEAEIEVQQAMKDISEHHYDDDDYSFNVIKCPKTVNKERLLIQENSFIMEESNEDTSKINTS